MGGGKHKQQGGGIHVQTVRTSPGKIFNFTQIPNLVCKKNVDIKENIKDIKGS